MSVEQIHVHLHRDDFDRVERQMALVLRTLEALMATQQELIQKVTALDATLDKIGAETTASLAEITNLKALLANKPDADPELVAAVDRLSVRLTNLDNMVPDAPPPPAP